MEIDPKRLIKFLTPLATLSGAVKSAEGLTPESSLDRWSESLLKHGREAEKAVDQLMDVFLRMMDEQQPERESTTLTYTEKYTIADNIVIEGRSKSDVVQDVLDELSERFEIRRRE